MPYQKQDINLDFSGKRRMKIIASEVHWRLPSSPIVGRICMCSRRSRREDDDADDEDDDDGDDDDDDIDDDDEAGGRGGEEGGEELTLKSSNPNLTGGELTKIIEKLFFLRFS